MPDRDSSDVLANLPSGRPARRSSRRAPAGGAAAKESAATKPAAAAKKPAAAQKPAAAKKPATTAKKPAAAKKPATTAKKPAATKKPAAAKKPATTPKQPVTAAATAAPRRERLATPPEGRRADYSGSASHRARKVTTNRPWLPSSGFVLPDEKQANQITAALGGLGSALADVARLSLGVAQSLAVRQRDLEAPDQPELDSDS